MENFQMTYTELALEPHHFSNTPPYPLPLLLVTSMDAIVPRDMFATV